MKSDLSREDWLAIFEKAASLEGEGGKEACWRVVQLLGLDAAYYPGIQIALEQGLWRKAENPRGYVKTVARREVDRRRPLSNLLELPLDVIGGDDFSHDEVMDRLTYANGSSTAVRGGDGVWRPGGHQDDYGDDEYENPERTLMGSTSRKLEDADPTATSNEAAA